MDIRYLDMHNLGGGMIYVISILDNYSRALLANALSRTQDLAAFLIVLLTAVRAFGSPETLVSDSGGVFKANDAQRIYAALGIQKEQIERRQAWQSYIETHFNVQRRMADWHVSKATTWEELQKSHARWMADYNEQEDGRIGSVRTTAAARVRFSAGLRGPSDRSRSYTRSFR